MKCTSRGCYRYTASLLDLKASRDVYLNLNHPTEDFNAMET